LPVPYFHVVFTVPEEIAKIALGNQRVLYSILFACVSKTLLKMGSDSKHLGGQIGLLAILHTWGQNLEYHPHVHCVVAGGALRTDGRWIASGKKYFLPVPVLSQVFRGKFLSALNKAFNKGELRFSRKLSWLAEKKNFGSYLNAASKKQWVVYCKAPFGGPQQVLQYLGRYTHRIAISNHRLIAFKKGNVAFRWKDYRHDGQQKIMQLPAGEFIRRFLMHVVPSRFVRIRHYGFLANRNRAASILLIRSKITSVSVEHSKAELSDSSVTVPSIDLLDTCSVCKKGKMRRIAIVPALRPWDTS
jgi:hypothetical protein